MAEMHVGLYQVFNSGVVGLKLLGHTRSDPYALWTLGKQRKEARCIVTGETILVGSESFRPVGNQDYRGRRVSKGVVWAMIAHAVAEGDLEPDFEGWSDIAEWMAQE